MGKNNAVFWGMGSAGVGVSINSVSDALTAGVWLSLEKLPLPGLANS